MNANFYRCFSINLVRFLKAHNIKSISKFTHPVTGRTAWIYPRTQQLDTILSTWSSLNPRTNKGD